MFDYLRPHDGPVIEGLEEHEVVYGKDQPEYVPLRTLVVRNSGAQSAISRWTPTDEQRQAIANGADIMLEVLTFGGPLAPVLMMVTDQSGEQFAEWFAVSKGVVRKVKA